MSSDKAWQPSAEQRLAPRKPWRGAATLQVGQAALAVRGVDLSETGAGVACDLNLPIQTACKLVANLGLRDGRNMPLEVTARVVFCSYASTLGGFRVGLQFDKPSAQAHKALSAYQKQ